MFTTVFAEAAPATGQAAAPGTAEMLASFLPFILIFAVMYLIMIRPQKKKEKALREKISKMKVGDKVVSIGGICGKIVKTKDESIIIAVGADKVKFEMKRWAVSTVETHANRNKRVEEPSVEEEEVKKVMPKKLKKSSDIEGDE